MSPYNLIGERPGFPLINGGPARAALTISQADLVGWRHIFPDTSPATLDLIRAKKNECDVDGSVIGLSLNCDLGQADQIAEQLDGLQVAIDEGLLTGPADDGSAPRDIILPCPGAISNGKMTLAQVLTVFVQVQTKLLAAGLSIPVGLSEEKYVLTGLDICNNELVQGYIAGVKPWNDGGPLENEGAVLESAINDLDNTFGRASCDNFWFRMVETARPVFAGNPNFTVEDAGEYMHMAFEVQQASMAIGTSNGIIWHQSHQACWHQIYDDFADFSVYTCDCSTPTGCDQFSDLKPQTPLTDVFACSRIVSLPDVSVQTGNSSTADLIVNDGFGIEGIDILVSFDPSIIDVTGVNANILPGCSGVVNNGISGQSHIAIGCTTQLTSGQKSLATFSFTGTAAGMSPLSIDTCSLNEGAIDCTPMDGSVTVSSGP